MISRIETLYFKLVQTTTSPIKKILEGDRDNKSVIELIEKKKIKVS